MQNWIGGSDHSPRGALLAAALAEVREKYFAALNDYHSGDAGPVITLWAKSSIIAAEEAHLSAVRRAVLPAQWQEALGRPRANSAASRLIAYLSTSPVFTIDDLEERAGFSNTAASRAVGAMAAVGIVRGMTDRKRNQVWGADDVLVELEDLNLRIGARARNEL